MKKPEIDAQAVVATGAVVLGDVTVKKDVSIWYNTVVRGDSDRRRQQYTGSVRASCG